MKIWTKLTVGTAATLFATSALASGVETKAQSEEAQETTIRTIDANGQVGVITIYEPEERESVQGRLERQDGQVYVISDNAGDYYLNRVIPVDELPDPTLEVETVDTYTIEYRGVTYTNRVVNEES